MGGRSNSSAEKGWDFDIILDNLINDNSAHWSPFLYRKIYEIWNKTPFKFIHLDNLSDLFDNAIDYNKSDYDSHEYPNYISKKDLINKI